MWGVELELGLGVEIGLRLGVRVGVGLTKCPKDASKITKLVTNVSNTMTKDILCLSIGIPTYILNVAEEVFPRMAGVYKNEYVEIFEVMS